jgi:hypothetical protein
MADNDENVDASSEISSDVAAETSQETSEAAATANTASTDEAVAEVAADEHKAGDACVCPDGRAGTLHLYEAGFVCIPNHDQA